MRPFTIAEDPVLDRFLDLFDVPGIDDKLAKQRLRSDARCTHLWTRILYGKQWNLQAGSKHSIRYQMVMRDSTSQPLDT